jgi:hypothetical protein
VDYPVSHRQPAASIPWRALALIAGAVALLELVLLIVAGSALLVNPDARGASAARPKKTAPAPAKAKTAKTAHARTAAPVKTRPARPAPVAELPRRRVSVMVLNGNGINGAAAAAAHRVSRHGYRIGIVGNAPASDYTRSVVMYRRGFEGEGIRLARDLGVRLVGPLDGLRPGDLHGAQAVLVIGSS